MRTAEQFSAHVDRNFFTSETDRTQFADKGWDLNSLVGDPQFVDPANGDFRLHANSPALEIGFKNFPMDQFGVQRADLKAIARTPEFLAPIVASAQATQTIKTALWFGAKVSPLKGEEFSAFGVSKEVGGIHLLNVPQDSLAATYGLKAGDIVQAINETPTPTLKELRQVTRNTSDQSLSISYVREQQTRTLDIQPAL
jgi:membrane-associated protease RseP (regulator of RpoE activity)